MRDRCPVPFRPCYAANRQRLTLFMTVMAGVAFALPRQISAADPPELAKPFSTESVIKHPTVIGWPEGKTPQAPSGFQVTAFVTSIESPRWLYVLPNGDVLVALSRTLPKPPKEAPSPKEQRQAEGMKRSKTVTGDSPNQIMLLRDQEGDGNPEVMPFVGGIKQPFGMALHKDRLFIAGTDAVWVYPYSEGDTQLKGEPQKILDLPAGGYNNHWTRNLLIDEREQKLYISVGSASNVAEHGIEEEKNRACILQSNLDGSEMRVFAAGLRNPVGMAWEPTTHVLWTAVNERDELGDELVPDYLTSVKKGGFYGWPYSYFGQNEDPRRKGERPDLVEQAIVPDFQLGSHTASLGLAFYTTDRFPEKYRNGAFIGQRGSWNRSKFAGYQVAFVPFAEGRPAGKLEAFLSGFIANENEVYGRPVGVAVAKDGSLLVADEPGNVIWRVTVAGP